jgi:hypothetical protein
METKISRPIFVPQGLQTQVQTLKQEIAHSPISPKKYQDLTKKLDVTLEKLDELEKTSNLFAKQLKEKVIDLYKDLEDGRVEGEVKDIQQRSTSLKKGRVTVSAVKKLETGIADLEKHHLPSIPHRRIIAAAKNALQEAKAKLEGKPPQRRYEMLSEPAELMPGDVEELFDIAKAVYNCDFRQAKTRLRQLPESHLQRFQDHMKQLLASPFDDPL